MYNGTGSMKLGRKMGNVCECVKLQADCWNRWNF